MSLPFVIVQGPIFITDVNGNIIGTKNIAGELDGSGNAQKRLATSSVAEGVLDDAATTNATEDQPAPVRITPKRAVHVNLRDQSGVELGTVGNPTKVRNTITGGGVYANIVVGLTAVEVKVGGSRLANRKLVTVFAVDRDLYWGYSNAVTIANGTPIWRGQLATWDADDVAEIWLITDAASKNARITESP